MIAPMCFLSDRDLMVVGPSLVTPFDPECVGPASIDLHLSTEFVVPDVSARLAYIDLDAGEDKPRLPMKDLVDLHDEDGFVLHPGEFCLGVTMEQVNLPNNIVGRIEGKSSLGRLGLMVHVTSGFIDPGFRGGLTLQMTNLLRIPIVLRPHKRICQVVFAYLNSPAMNPYGGNYQDSQGVVASKGVTT
jgi:dCTP deaminase